MRRVWLVLVVVLKFGVVWKLSIIVWFGLVVFIVVFLVSCFSVVCYWVCWRLCFWVWRLCWCCGCCRWLLLWWCGWWSGFCFCGIGGFCWVFVWFGRFCVVLFCWVGFIWRLDFSLCFVGDSCCFFGVSFCWIRFFWCNCVGNWWRGVCRIWVLLLYVSVWNGFWIVGVLCVVCVWWSVGFCIFVGFLGVEIGYCGDWFDGFVDLEIFGVVV